MKLNCPCCCQLDWKKEYIYSFLNFLSFPCCALEARVRKAAYCLCLSSLQTWWVSSESLHEEPLGGWYHKTGLSVYIQEKKIKGPLFTLCWCHPLMAFTPLLIRAWIPDCIWHVLTMCGCSMQRCVKTGYKITHTCGSMGLRSNMPRQNSGQMPNKWSTRQQWCTALTHLAAVPMLVRGMREVCPHTAMCL